MPFSSKKGGSRTIVETFPEEQTKPVKKRGSSSSFTDKLKNSIGFGTAEVVESPQQVYELTEKQKQAAELEELTEAYLSSKNADLTKTSYRFLDGYKRKKAELEHFESLNKTISKAEFKPRFFPKLEEYSPVLAEKAYKNKFAVVEKEINLLVKNERVLKKGSTYLLANLFEINKMLKSAEEKKNAFESPNLSLALTLITKNIESVKPKYYLNLYRLLQNVDHENIYTWKNLIEDLTYKARMLNSPYESLNEQDLLKCYEILNNLDYSALEGNNTEMSRIIFKKLNDKMSDSNAELVLLAGERSPLKEVDCSAAVEYCSKSKLGPRAAFCFSLICARKNLTTDLSKHKGSILKHLSTASPAELSKAVDLVSPSIDLTQPILKTVGKRAKELDSSILIKFLSKCRDVEIKDNSVLKAISEGISAPSGLEKVKLTYLASDFPDLLVNKL